MDYYATHPTPDELDAILGKDWGICRNSFENRRRYGRCITRKEYRAAVEQAMTNRENGE